MQQSSTEFSPSGMRNCTTQAPLPSWRSGTFPVSAGSVVRSRKRARPLRSSDCGVVRLEAWPPRGRPKCNSRAWRPVSAGGREGSVACWHGLLTTPAVELMLPGIAVSDGGISASLSPLGILSALLAASTPPRPCGGDVCLVSTVANISRMWRLASPLLRTPVPAPSTLL